jgi:hypothetical protein
LNELGGISVIHLQDNGTGIVFTGVDRFFGNLSGSWKLETTRSPQGGRTLHGKTGRGRFRSFALDDRVQWHSVCEAGTILEEFTITGALGTLGTFEVSSPRPSPAETTGTVVCVSDISAALPSLLGDSARILMTQEFALYLTQYRDVRIHYDGVDLSPAVAVTETHTFDIRFTSPAEGDEASAHIEVLEWKARAARGLVLCDVDGFPPPRDGRWRAVSGL